MTLLGILLMALGIMMIYAAYSNEKDILAPVKNALSGGR